METNENQRKPEFENPKNVSLCVVAKTFVHRGRRDLLKKLNEKR